MKLLRGFLDDDDLREALDRARRGSSIPLLGLLEFQTRPLSPAADAEAQLQVKVRGMNRGLHDLTSKPPRTIGREQ